MAKRVSFSKPKKSPKGGDTSFNFGLNAMNKTQKRAYRKALKKVGHGGGS